jgi:hypothetical protein
LRNIHRLERFLRKVVKRVFVTTKFYHLLKPVYRKLKSKVREKSRKSLIRKSKDELKNIFDAKWYRQRYNLIGSDEKIFRHYIKYGILDNKDPNPNFSSKNYLLLHRDVNNSTDLPVIHFLNCGAKENRLITKSIEEYKTLESHCTCSSDVSLNSDKIIILKIENDSLSKNNLDFLRKILFFVEDRSDIEIVFISTSKILKFLEEIDIGKNYKSGCTESNCKKIEFLGKAPKKIVYFDIHLKYSFKNLDVLNELIQDHEDQINFIKFYPEKSPDENYKLGYKILAQGFLSQNIVSTNKLNNKFFSDIPNTSNFLVCGMELTSKLITTLLKNELNLIEVGIVANEIGAPVFANTDSPAVINSGFLPLNYCEDKDRFFESNMVKYALNLLKYENIDRYEKNVIRHTFISLLVIGISEESVLLLQKNYWFKQICKYTYLYIEIINYSKVYDYVLITRNDFKDLDLFSINNSSKLIYVDIDNMKNDSVVIFEKIQDYSVLSIFKDPHYYKYCLSFSDKKLTLLDQIGNLNVVLGNTSSRHLSKLNRLDKND